MLVVYVAYKKWESSCSPVSATVISNPPLAMWTNNNNNSIPQHRNTPNTPPLPKFPLTEEPSSHSRTPHIFLKVTLPQNLIVGLSSPKGPRPANRDQDKWKPIFAPLQTNSWSLGDGPFPESSDRKNYHTFLLSLLSFKQSPRVMYI